MQALPFHPPGMGQGGAEIRKKLMGVAQGGLKFWLVESYPTPFTSLLMQDWSLQGNSLSFRPPTRLPVATICRSHQSSCIWLNILCLVRLGCL